MQQVYREHLVARSATYRERIAQMRRSRANGSDPPADVLHEFVANRSTSSSGCASTSRRGASSRPPGSFSGAQRIHVVAQRRAFPVAFYLAYALNQLEFARSCSIRCRRHAAPARSAAGAEGRAARGELPQLLGRRRRGRRPRNARGVTVVAITDSALSPLKRFARVAFEIGDDPAPVPLAGRAAVPRAGAVSSAHVAERNGETPARAQDREAH